VVRAATSPRFRFRQIARVRRLRGRHRGWRRDTEICSVARILKTPGAIAQLGERLLCNRWGRWVAAADFLCLCGFRPLGRCRGCGRIRCDPAGLGSGGGCCLNDSLAHPVNSLIARAAPAIWRRWSRRARTRILKRRSHSCSHCTSRSIRTRPSSRTPIQQQWCLCLHAGQVRDVHPAAVDALQEAGQLVPCRDRRARLGGRGPSPRPHRLAPASRRAQPDERCARAAAPGEARRGAANGRAGTRVHREPTAHRAIHSG
jgi:hypothetical protein